MKTLVALVALSFSFVGCGNKDHEKCMEQVKKYTEMTAACASKTGAEKEACTAKAEVNKMTPKDCDDAHK